MKYKTIEEVYKKLDSMIDEKKRIIDEIGHYSDKEIKEYYDQFEKAFKAMDKSMFTLSSKRIGEYCYNLDAISRLTKVKKENLMLINSRYLLAPKGSKLINPSGFYPNDRVFYKINNCIGVDFLPKSSNMNYWDLKKTDKYFVL